MAAELLWLGLAEQKAKETAKNGGLTELLVRLVGVAREELTKTGNNSATITKPQGTLVYQLGTRAKPQIDQWLSLVIRHIITGGIKNEPQLAAAVEFLLSHTVSGVVEEDFEKASGIGVVITPAQIEDAVGASISKHRETLLVERYKFPVGKILGEVKQLLQWADGAAVKREVDLRILELVGPRTNDELSGQGQKKKDDKAAPGKRENGVSKQDGKAAKAAAGAGAEANAEEEGAETIEELMRTRARFHKVGENFKTEGYVVTQKTQELLAKHVKEVGGKVQTRFPPEPNGILHIGHAKAININFGYAKAFGGKCNLRFDDTNPEKEEAKFFHAIEDIVKWLGYTPAKITYSSDNFEQLYKWAVELINKDLAYVCHQTVEEMRGFDVKASPWRDRPVADSLRLFEDMKNGKLAEGAATLRLKMTLEEGKLDPVAYRIKFTAHHRTGDTWCIYPTYDYTHCLCDSIENITHSLCTKEFQSRRSSYYWLCNALDIYCPVQWEYGRLNVNYTVVSKRKILKLITTKTVGDWDDPRLFTLTALRRRGIPPEAINKFVARLGLTMSQMAIDPHALDAATRDYLNIHAPRTMAVLEGLQVRIENFDELAQPSEIDVPDFPSDPNSKRHKVAVDRDVYIEKSDYRQSGEDDKGFRRLTPKQTVGLKSVGLVLTLVKEEKDADGELTGLVVKAAPLTEENKPKAFIHWVAKPLHVEVRLYDRLFQHPNPEDATEVPGGFLSDCKKDTLTVLHHALVDKYLKDVKELDRFQFERIGYFSIDEDSRPGKLVFNRTVLLKEDGAKN